jgi:hypothetical protein
MDECNMDSSVIENAMATEVHNADEMNMEKPTRNRLGRAPADRERLCNDMINTSVMAALIGGFAFNNLGALAAPLQSGDAERLDVGIYMLNVVAVHLCTCSCLMSAFIYSVVNRLEDEAVPDWAASMPWKMMLPMPMGKFATGCVFYLISVVVMSYRDLEHEAACRWLAFLIGAGSVCSVFGTGAIVMLKG